MLALTSPTGVGDPVSDPGLDRVFTGNMIGDVVILAMRSPGPMACPLKTIMCRHSRTTHVRGVQLEMSLRRNHATATVVKNSA